MAGLIVAVVVVLEIVGIVLLGVFGVLIDNGFLDLVRFFLWSFAGRPVAAFVPLVPFPAAAPAFASPGTALRGRLPFRRIRFGVCRFRLIVNFVVEGFGRRFDLRRFAGLSA